MIFEFELKVDVESVVVSRGEVSGKVDVEVEVGSVRWFVQSFTAFISGKCLWLKRRIFTFSHCDSPLMGWSPKWQKRKWNSYKKHQWLEWETDCQRKQWVRYLEHEWFAWVDKLDDDGYGGEDKEFWTFWTSIMSCVNTMDVKVYREIASDVGAYRHLDIAFS